MTLDAAYAVCARLARRHYENFPVASRLLPRRMRPHIAAIYAFARVADDFADEGARPADIRLALLDDWDARLRAAADGRIPAGEDDDAAIFTALAATIRDCRIDVRLLEDLLSAFRQDVTVRRYASWDDLLDYCRRSANPVGRLVLAVSGVAEDEACALSDKVCTALQLTNFWQDLEIDWQRGRLYVPASVVDAHGADEFGLNRGHLGVAWKAALRDVVQRTRALFTEGRGVADVVTGRLRWELRATWLGGMRILDKLEHHGFDPFAHRPSLSVRDVPSIARDAVLWRK